ncbi:SAG family member (sag9), partial [Eimeria tenella]
MMLQWNLSLLLRISFLMLSATTLASSQETEETVTYTASLGNSFECLSEVNAAREAAGLANFKEMGEEDKLSSPQPPDLEDGSQWKKLCEHLIPKTETAAQSKSTNPFEAGTYAFKSLTAEQPNCKETVAYWKAAYKNFTGLPPSRKEAGTLYNKQDNVSFVAVYTSYATADCRVVTCTQTNTSTAGPVEVTTDGGSATTKKGYALLCKTMPAAFASDTSAPFTFECLSEVNAAREAAGLANFKEMGEEDKLS